jgi:ubiquinone biosynthesis protein UbiJ
VPVVKVSVSIDEKDLRWLRRQAKRRRKSLSSVLTESVQQARRERALDEVLRWLEAPKLTLERLDEFRREWGAD